MSRIFASFAAGAALALIGTATAGAQVVTQPAPYRGSRSQIKALVTSNPATYSNRLFTAPPAVNPRDGFSGSSVPPPVVAPWTSSATYPPGANGPQAPGGQASGSMLGGAG